MKQAVLKHALTDKPAAADFELIDVDTPACPEGGVLVQVKHNQLCLAFALFVLMQ